jgi:hypothetical protein
VLLQGRILQITEGYREDDKYGDEEEEDQGEGETGASYSPLAIERMSKLFPKTEKLIWTPLPLWMEFGIERKEETEDEVEEWTDCEEETEENEEVRDRIWMSGIPCGATAIRSEALESIPGERGIGAGDISGEGVSMVASSKRYWPTLMKISRGMSLSWGRNPVLDSVLSEYEELEERFWLEEEGWSCAGGR